MPKFSGVKAVLIDFDGTLVNSVPALFHCYKKFLANHRKKGAKKEFSSLVGPALPEIVQILKRNHHIKTSSESLLKEYKTLVKQCYEQDVKLHAYVEETLIFLKNAGLRLAIVTSAPQILVKKFLISHQLEGFFDEIISARDKEPPKPDPAIYVRALRKMKLMPQHALAIEDSPNGCSSALTAGICTIYLTNKKQITNSKTLCAHMIQYRAWKEILHHFS